jgi:hypothetical protein
MLSYGHTEAATPYICDTSLQPLLWVEYRGVSTPDELAQCLERATASLRQGGKALCIIDASRTWMVSAAERLRCARWLEANEALLREQVLGVAFVGTSPLVRLSLNIVCHLRTPPFPYFIASHVRSAGHWAAERLEALGLRAQAWQVRERFDPHPPHVPGQNDTWAIQSPLLAASSR